MPTIRLKTTLITVAVAASSRDSCRCCAIVGRTGVCRRQDVPKSPRNSFPSHVRYCRTGGLSRPSWARRAATACGGHVGASGLQVDPIQGEGPQVGPTRPGAIAYQFLGRRLEYRWSEQIELAHVRDHEALNLPGQIPALRQIVLDVQRVDQLVQL